MRDFAFYLLLLSIIIPIIQAYRKPAKICELPFLYSIAIMVYILPPLLGVKGNDLILSNSEYIHYTIFTTVCFWSAVLGYNIYNSKNKNTRNLYLYDEKKFSIALYCFMVMAFVAIIILGNFDINNRIGGAYAVILYPSRALRPATIMLFVLYLVSPSKDKLFFLIVSLLFSLKIIIVDGRRSEVFNLFITIVFPLFFAKGKSVPRYFILPSIIISILVFTLLPVIRQYTLTGNYSKVLTISPAEIIKSQAEGISTNEVVDAAKSMEVVRLGGKYNWGITIYNNFVFQYVSGTFFGEDTKANFSIKPNVEIENLRYKYSRSDTDFFKYYLAPTGVGAAFTEFGYGGCIVFFLFGLMTKRFFENAIRRDNISSLMFYCFFATFILFSVYDSLFSIPTFIILYLFVFYVSKGYAKIAKLTPGFDNKERGISNQLTDIQRLPENE
jgi:oligosaccharide repeat unit polymerase